MATIDDLVKGGVNPNQPMGKLAIPPAMAGAQPSIDEGQQPATPDQVQELRDLLDNVQNENARLVSNKVLSRNQLQIMKQKLFGELFQLLQDVGVDPSNPESVKNFLLQLERQDPDLLEIFQSAFAGLAADETAAPEEAVVPGVTPPTGEEEPPVPLTERFRNLDRFAA